MDILGSKDEFVMCNKKRSLQILAVSIVLALIAKAGVASQPACLLKLSSGPQLFLDDFLIDDMQNLTRVMDHPRALPEPIIEGEDSHYRNQPFTSTIYYPEENLFRMWYSCFAKGAPLTQERPLVHAYAESKDGLNWRFPSLGLKEINGSKQNNALLTCEIGINGYPVSVVDRGAQFPDSHKRFVFVGYLGTVRKLGVGIAFSADGITWKAHEKNPVLDHYAFGQLRGDIVEVFYDKVNERYLMTLCVLSTKDEGFIAVSPRPNYSRRLVALSESKDFINWTKPRRIIVSANKLDTTEFYGLTINYLNGLYVGLLRILRDDLAANPDGEIAGIGWTELAVSRDGENWQRLPGKFFDRNTTPGSWSNAMGWIGSVVYLEKEMFFYFGGYDSGHKVGTRQIGISRMPLHRFMALEERLGKRGILKTKKFTTECTQLTLNCQSGHIRVQLLDKNGSVIPGYSLDDCDVLRGNSLSKTVKWKDKAELPDAKSDGIAVEIELQNASLWAVNLE
jgi:hypothetical protein